MRLVIGSILVIFATSLTFGQGLPNWSTIESHPYYSINLNDLSVVFNVPIRQKAGLIPFSYVVGRGNTVRVQYDQNGLNGKYVIDPAFYGAANSYVGATAPIPPKGSGPAGGNGAVSYSTYKISQTCTGYEEFAASDQYGTVHSFSGAIAPCPSGTLDTDAVDGSGLHLHGVWPGPIFTLYDNAGDVLNPGGAQGANASFTDPNGNTISVDSTGKIFTDSLGQTVLTLSTSTANNIRTNSYTWTDANGANKSVEITGPTNGVMKTSFGCASTTEANQSNFYYPTNVSYPDGSNLVIGYESVAAGSVTGRINSLILPTGGQITFTYSGPHKGLYCNYQPSPIGLTITTPDGTWVYAATLGSTITPTTVIDPQGNETDYTFYGGSVYQYQKKIYQGSASTGTLLKTETVCWNNTTCGSGFGGAPTTQRDVYTTLGSMSTSSAVKTSYATIGVPTEIDSYDFGASAPTVKQSVVLGNYSGGACTAFANTHIQNRVCTVTTSDGASKTLSQVRNTYDANGNKTAVSNLTGGSSYLTSNFSYNPNGTVNVSTDVNGAQTTYYYNGTGGCNNAFVTSVSEPLSLSKSMTWNCDGGVMTSVTDENGKTTTYDYVNSSGIADPFWRQMAVVDPLGNTTNLTYTPTSVESKLSFNGGNSVVDVIGEVDGLGRRHLAQTRQGPTSTNYDTVQYSYDSNGRLATVSLPCSQPLGSGCSGGTTTTFDAANRPLQVTDGGGGYTSYSYNKRDTLVTVGPAPSGENTKRRQLEYDGLGRLTSACEISSGPGSGSCAQDSATTGYWTKYAYDTYTSGSVNYQRSTIAQNSHATPQTRTYLFDGLQRLSSETNPESGTKNYVYDSDATMCGNGASTQPGNLLKTTDAAGNCVMYYYDALNRVTDVGNNNQSTVNHCKRFRYDNSNGILGTIPPGVTISNSLGRLVEAETDDCTWPVTQAHQLADEWSSYSPRGELADAYEWTQHSGSYYHTTATYWANGALNTFSGIPGQNKWTFGIDGEGRLATAVQGSTNLVTSTSYNAASQPLNTVLGAGDSDTYVYDQNTNRMTKYTLTAGSTPKSLVGSLTWNANGSLSSVAVTDGFNAAGTHTCKYGDPSTSVPGYDDLGRLIKVDCTASIWQQNFSYDAFGNLTKTVPTGGTGIAWNPGYNAANNHYTLSGTSYDANGNLLTDTFHTYTWDADGHLATIDSSACGTNGTCVTYDAFGRPVEKNVQGTYSEILYSQLGKTAVMNGSSVLNLYIPLPSGAVYNFIPGYALFRHKDWRGSARLSTTLGNRTARYDRAFAPFGEVYLNFGATDGNDFTGDTQDILPGNDASGGVVGLYDTPARELHPSQGRWLSPDPAGFSVVDMGNPQTWNRYAYVTNNPLVLTDPTGTDNCDEQIDGCDDQLFDAKTFGFADLRDSVLLDQSSGLDSPGMQGILEGENSINFPGPGLFQTIWGDVLGLPTDLSCPQGLSPLCGGVNPVMDATRPLTADEADRIRFEADRLAGCPQFSQVGRDLMRMLNSGKIIVNDAMGRDVGGRVRAYAFNPQIELSPGVTDMHVLLHEWVHTTQFRGNPLNLYLSTANWIQGWFNGTGEGFLDHSADAVAFKIIDVCGNP